MHIFNYACIYLITYQHTNENNIYAYIKILVSGFVVVNACACVRTRAQVLPLHYFDARNHSFTHTCTLTHLCRHTHRYEYPHRLTHTLSHTPEFPLKAEHSTVDEITHIDTQALLSKVYEEVKCNTL